MRKKLFAAAVALLATATVGHSAQYDQPVASNAYISYNGYDWAWASPLTWEDVDLSYQSQFGWRIPTAVEIGLAPVAALFQFAGANVPFGGSDPVSGSNFQYSDASLTGAAACAAAYFSNGYVHCDWGNGPGTLNDPQPWSYAGGPSSYWETLVIRDAGENPSPVPVPATLPLLGGAVAAIAGFARKRRRA